MIAGQNTSIVTNHHEAALTQARELRQLARVGKFKGPTSGFAPGLAQGNVVILPKSWADDFLLFCQQNPIACPLLAVSAPGKPILDALGEDIDIRTDVPEYRVFRHGELSEETSDITDLWRTDLVTFVLGCSFSFEDSLMRAGLSLRNIDCNANVSMYRTNIATNPSQYFSGDMVVSMRPFKPADAIRAVQITTRYPKSHGAPIHLGYPEMIGIKDLSKPDFGDPVPINDDEIPVFWACGVTPQLAIANACPPIAITHSPGKMLVTDVSNDQLSIL
ncbi:hypothetical protein A1OQ_17485 [Enterovibrio norvegicus FF-162]|uniref:putative hydro-lyase n=1 Tax=Enterovibrio TaxID=188143 RepID=UPI0002DA9EA2|nr:putative hydro-lyase [Enterovibrio norvegicus]OEE85934.1 hypothetical protein A1OQ_17485 [Enterovibrio norvegicus FF-162]